MNDYHTARNAIEERWTPFLRSRGVRAVLEGWRPLTAADGSRLLSVEVTGPQAARALEEFVRHPQDMLQRVPGDQAPVFDYSDPRRAVCELRTCGVWVQLWHPERPRIPAFPPPAPSPMAAFLAAAGARLPIGRKTTSTKET